MIFIRKNYKIFISCIHAIKITIQADKFYFIGYILLRIFSSAESVIMYIFLPTFILQQIHTAVTLKVVIFIILISLIVLIIFKFYIVWFRENYSMKSKEKIKNLMLNDMIDIMKNVNLGDYDNKEFYDRNINAVSQVEETILALLDNIGKLIQELFTISSIIVLIMAFNYNVLLIVILLVTIIKLILGNYINKINFLSNYRLNVLNKKDNYIQRIFYLKNYAKELRTSNINEVVIDQYNQNINEKRQLYKELTKKTFLSSISLNFLANTLLVYGVIPLYIIYKIIVEKTIDLAEFVILINSTQKMITSFDSIIDKLKNIIDKNRYYNLYLEFIKKYKVDNFVPKTSTFQTIEKLELRQISFAYDNKNLYSLRNINLTIKKGEKIAIVGQNGSGKSTLTKILMGFYEPTSGEFYINDNQIKDIEFKSIQHYITYIPQNNNIYPVSVAENIALDVIFNLDSIENVIKEVNLLESQDISLQQNVTKEFDKNGLELSGGQIQKMILSRAFYQNRDTIILDEPTSMIDPISEHSINQHIIDAFADKSIILITHRLYCANMMDRIIMLSNGEIVGDGSHEELMANNVQYSTLYNAQYKNISSLSN